MTHALLALALCAALQSPAFEVASIKPSKPDDTHFSTHERAGQVFLENIPLKEAVLLAYDLKDYAISAPDWMNTVRFDIVAKPTPGATRAQMQSLQINRVN